MKVYKGVGIFQHIRASYDAPDEEAWLVVPDEETRAIWHRKDGSIIRPWSSDYALIPLTYAGLTSVPYIGAAIGTPFIDPSLLVDEGL